MILNPVKLYSNKINNKQPVSFKGWIPEEQNRDPIYKICEFINNPNIKKVALNAHKNLDGDATASVSSFYDILTEKGKDVKIFMIDQPSHKLKSLRHMDKYISIPEDMSAEEISKKYGRFDLAISLDCPQINLMGENLYEGLFKQAKHTVKIDHHEEEDPEYNFADDINFVDPNSSSNAQLVMQFAQPLKINVRQETAQMLAVGLYSDTGAFSYFKEGKKSFDLKDRKLLRSKGVDVKNLHLLFNKTPKEVFLVVDELKNNIRTTKNDKLSYLVITDNQYKKYGLDKEFKPEIKGIFGSLYHQMSKKSPEAFFIAHKNKKENCVDFHIRTTNVNLLPFYEKYKNAAKGKLYMGGHKHAGVVKISGDITGEKVDTVIKDLQKALNN